VEVLLVIVALVLVLGLGFAPILRRRARPVAPHREASALEASEINEAFARVQAEGSPHLERLLRLRTKDLIARRVPVRQIRTAPAPEVARIAFGNGVVVLATTKTPGDLARMARAMTVTSVVLEQMRVTEQGPVLRFTWRYRHHLEVYAVGLDQAD
jgi:hypothetical protein